MKEHTYGWYPSARNVYEERRLGAPTPYQIEALYRYRDSKYYQPPVTPPEQRSPQPARPASVQRPPSYRPATAASTASKASKQTKEPGLTLRAKSVPLQTKYKPPPKLALPTPLECWSSPTPEAEVKSLPDSVKPSSRSSYKPITPMATPISIPGESAIPEAAPITTPATTPVKVTHPPSAPKSFTSYVKSPAATPIVIPCAQPEVTKAPSTPASVNKYARIQSAKVRRDSSAKPQRPVKSAGPFRASPSHAPSPHIQTETRESPKPIGTIRESPLPMKTDFDFAWPQPDTLAEEEMIDRTTPLSFTHLRPSPQPQTPLRPTSSQKPPSFRPSVPSPAERPPSKKSSLRPKAPSPYKMERMTIDEDEMFRAETPDYDEEAKKHGWLMEVHGDPLNLKKISRRLPYTVKCEEPETERDPPKIHMENIETFFLNTIPRRPMAFTIDKEWISEMIHAKRMELQKRDKGINYRYKNFSFVY